MKDCIRDFVQSWQQYDRELGQDGIKWVSRFRDAGYHSAMPGSLEHWPHIHQWCVDTLGRDHYVWTGNTFWFESEQHANWFRLRWS